MSAQQITSSPTAAAAAAVLCRLRSCNATFIQFLIAVPYKSFIYLLTSSLVYILKNTPVPFSGQKLQEALDLV